MEESPDMENSEVQKKESAESRTLAAPKIQHQNSIVALQLEEDQAPPLSQAQSQETKTQKKLTLSLPEENNENGQYTKRSDESQFVNWEITTVKSGKFFFSEKQKDSIMNDDEAEPQITINPAEDLKKEQKKPEQSKKEKKRTAESSNLKLLKTLSSAKKQLLKYFTEELSLALKKMKAVKMLFAHFCKENNLTSMKSTLFEDKQKVMEEMSLNKWMVFCKEFDILERMCLKSVEQSKQGENSTQEHLQNKEQRRVKALKKAQTTIIDIFKAVNQNKSKINFDDFVSGLILIYEEFKSAYSYNEEGAKKFLTEVLYCESEKQCLMKLSGLKFTAGTPKISYEKQIVAPVTVSILSKSRFNKNNQKENAQASDPKLTKVRTSPFGSRGQLNMNPIIRQAKQSLERKGKPKYSQHHNQRSKVKLVLGDINAKKEKSNTQHELIQFFQETKDPILDSYFVLQRKKLTGRDLN